MKKFILFLIVLCFSIQANAYDKKSVVERFTNCSCGPCATINNAWYNATTASLLDSGAITHIIYNVDWPSPTDPMHLLNAADNNTRRRYYGVNAVPWIEVNGTTISASQSALLNAVTSGNSEYAPFNIIITPEVFSNNVINVHVKIIRDPGDNTTFGTTKLRVALLEKRVEFASPPGSNGESIFYSVCRKMLTDAFGCSFTIPAPGDSTELDLLYIPTTDFLQSVNYDSLKVAAFIQDDDTKEVYQSVMANQLIPSNNVNAAFQVEENFGASPLVVNFSDFSTATSTTNIVSWEWDFDNDGTIDSNDPEPTWIYNTEQSYTVKLTVSDGNEQHSRIITDYITVLGAVSDILVVNGISYTTYLTQMEDLYNNSACFGNHQVDLWDLFGDQNFDYSANPNIQQIVLENQAIPNSILNQYGKVIWIGNSYAGDLTLYDPSQVLDYIGQGGNFLLASRQGADFFSTELRNYCGITSLSGLSALTQLIALDDSLVNVAPVGTNDRNQFVQLGTTSEATPIFDDDTTTNWIAGFRIQKENEGAFIYIAGRPYRFDNTAMFHNYNFMINYWLPLSSMRVQSPNGGEIWVVGETEDITWTAVNVDDVKIELSVDNGSSWSTIIESNPNTGTYSWTVATQDSSDECFIRITNVANGYVFDVSDDVFIIDIISTVEELLGGIPTEFDLNQNYPNPFNPSTKITYSLAKEEKVSLKVYDIMGQVVEELVNEKQSAGRYSVEFDASSFSSGLYIYSLTAGTFNSAKKMVLMK